MLRSTASGRGSPEEEPHSLHSGRKRRPQWQKSLRRPLEIFSRNASEKELQAEARVVERNGCELGAQAWASGFRRLLKGAGCGRE